MCDQCKDDYITKYFPIFMQMDYNDESAIIAID